ncbi:MAG: prepilin-type N-terminal cleavage/methylation domain-containing protein [Eubacteriales bacterium]|nr:prepilin-type N-terminal cleavage/methylation domain-containing protein [Eubacteriales bacterium]
MKSVGEMICLLGKSSYKRARNHKGFTLIEMVVVMAILSILLGLSVVGMLGWQDWADFNRQNEYAQTLFLAAQSQLAEYSESGQLGQLEQMMKDEHEDYSNVIDPTTLRTENGLYELDKVWYQSGGDSAYQTSICSVSAQAGDYSKYMQGQKTASDTAPILFQIVSAYVYDTSVLDAAICLEFTPSEGQVFAVCFSDKNSSLVYRAPEKEGEVDITDRSENVRYDNKWGYYGVDTLTVSKGGEKKQPKLVAVHLNDEDTLNLSFRVTEVDHAERELKYNIVVTDYYKDWAQDDSPEKNEKILSFNLDGKYLHNYEHRSMISCPVIRYTYSETGEEQKEELGNYDILAWMDEDNTIRIVLDAADIQASSYLYKKSLLGGVTKPANNGTKISDMAFTKTLSFHRFGVDAEEISCAVQAFGDDYRSSMVKESNQEHVYFAEQATKKEITSDGTNLFKMQYALKNARHLYNVRYIEDIEKDVQYTYGKTALLAGKTDIQNTFSIKEDIDWGTFVENGNLYFTKVTPNLDEENSVIMGALKRPTIVQIENGLPGTNGAEDEDPDMGNQSQKYARYATKADFPSIRQLRYTDEMEAKQLLGEDKTISNISISLDTNNDCLVYQTAIDEMNAKDEANRQKVEKPVGLFVMNLGKIESLRLDKVTVEGQSKVGAFCGTNVGTLTKLETWNTNRESVITGESHVGGILGYQAGVLDDSKITADTDLSVELKELKNHAKVQGTWYVGGILGKITIPEEKNNIKMSVLIEECDNYGALEPVNSVSREGDIEHKELEPRYIGGIVGLSENLQQKKQYVPIENATSKLIIQECNSSPSYATEDVQDILKHDAAAKEKLQKYLNGVYVGGIVGFNCYGEIVECSTKPEQGKVGYVFGNQYVGGVVGFNQGPALGVESGILRKQGENDATVVGNQYVGGIVGCSSDVNKKQLLQVDAALKAKYAKNESLKESEWTQVIGPVIEPEKERNMHVVVKNWVNKGVVYAADCYAGGITGYNAGWVYQCDSEVDNSETSGYFQEIYAGDYAGGIAGYNNGIIGNTDRDQDGKCKTKADGTPVTGEEKKAICNVTGKNYIGGIVGYNDADAIIEDYALSGGHILGEENDSTFVGGFAGLNASILLLQDENGKARTISATPNEVSGQYCVGGSIGGNIINTNGYNKKDNSGDAPVDEPTTQATTQKPPVVNPPAGELNPDINVNVKDKKHYNGNYYGDIDFSIKNSTNVNWKSWSLEITLPETPIFSDNFWNCKKTIQDNKMIIIPLDWNKNIMAGNTQNGSGCYIGFSSEAALNQFIENIKRAKIIYEADLGRQGAAPDGMTGDCSVQLKRTGIYGTNSNENPTSQYLLTCKNNTATAITDWRVEIEIPDGIELELLEAWGDGAYEKVNKKIMITPPTNGKSIPAKGSIEFGFKVRTRNVLECFKFSNTVVSIYTNGILSGVQDGRNTDQVDKPYKIELVQSNVWQENGKYRTQYEYKVINETDEPIEGWGIEIETGNRDFEVVSGWVNHEKQDGLLIILPHFVYDSIIPAHGSVSGNFQIVSKNKADIVNLAGGKTNTFEYYHGNQGNTEPGDDGILRIKTNFQTNNFLGQVKGNVCVGGFIGYNLFVDSNDQDFVWNLTDTMHTKLQETTTLETCNTVLNALKESDAYGVGEYSESKVQFYVAGNQSKRASSLAQVTGAIHIGGVVGYDDCGTELYFDNIINGTPVTATAAIENADEQDEYADIIFENEKPIRKERMTYQDEVYTYSYTGGIIGRANRNVTITRCKNAGTAVIKTKGTYIGGLCEVNDGLIKLCECADIGASTKDYIGSICGLNKYQVEDCKLVGKTMHGRNYLGGIASENFGTIQGVTIENTKLVVSGKDSQSVAGTLAAYNGGRIIVCSDLKNVMIDARGSYVGTVAGINEGTVTKRDELENVMVTGSVKGNQCVGGVIGENRSIEKISHFVNQATVHADYGEAGGIVGRNTLTGEIADCINEATVTAEKDGNAGGITAENIGTISNCIDYGVIAAPKGVCGGIASDNAENATIVDCMVTAKNGARLQFSSLRVTGGVVASNEGTIERCIVENVDVTNYKSSKVSDIGALVGVNEQSGNIVLPAGEVAKNCTAVTYSDGSNVGGLVGSNKGVLRGQVDNSKRPATQVKNSIAKLQKDYATVANIGGAVGRNSGIVENISVEEELQGNMGAKNVGLGGVVGASLKEDGPELQDTEVRVSNCEFNGKLSGNGSAAKVLAIGGIVGFNGAGSKVSACAIGTEKETQILAGVNKDGTLLSNGKDSYVYMGGIVGDNYGTVLSCDNNNAVYRNKKAVAIVGAKGNIGGIIGQNEIGGLVAGESESKVTATGSNWKIRAVDFFNDQGVGGIIGYSQSGKSIEFVRNYAYVELNKAGGNNNQSAGGIIGRIENQETRYMEIRDSINYGKVVGANRVGGFVATVKNKGIMILRCDNYGNVTCTGGNAESSVTSGFIATAYNVRGENIYMDECNNFGNITGNGYTAGFLAFNQVNPSPRYFTECINVGCINTSRQSGFAHAGITTATQSYLFECQNYGVTNDESVFAGLAYVPNNGSVEKMTNCFDDGGSIRPMAKTSNAKFSYYLAHDNVSAIDDYTGKGSVTSSQTLFADTYQINMLKFDLFDGYMAYSGDVKGLKHNPANMEKKNDFADYTGSTIRKPIYEEVHEKVKQAMIEMNRVETPIWARRIDTPKNPALTDSQKCFMMTWGKVPNAYCYEVKYEVVDANGKTIYEKKNTYVKGREVFEFQMQEEWEGCTVNAYVRAIAANDLIGDDGKIHLFTWGERSSDWVMASKKVKKLLPNPKVHLEMVDVGQVVAILDNQEDYRDYEDCQIVTELIHDNKVANRFVIDPKTGYSDQVQTLSETFVNNTFLTAQAKPTDEQSSIDKYAESVTSVIETTIFNRNVLNGTSNILGTQFNGFIGTMPEDLQYKIRFKASSYNQFVATDIEAYDAKVGADVVYVHEDSSHVTKNESFAILTGLPDDLVKQQTITVRAYPWVTMANQVHYMHEVGEAGSVDDLHSMVDRNMYQISGNYCEKTEQSIWTADGSLKPGYIICKTQKGRYQVFYNVLLANTRNGNCQVQQRVYRYDAETSKFVYDTSGIAQRPEPVLADTMDIQDHTYIFSWDKEFQNASAYENAEYAVDLVGITAKDEEIPLFTTSQMVTMSQLKSNNMQYAIEDTQGNWKYRKMRVRITRKGSEQNGYTDVLPNYTEKEYDTKLPLPQMEMPAVSLVRDGAQMNRHSTLHDISWTGILKSQDEYKDLAGYLITVKPEDENKQADTKYFYVKLKDVAVSLPNGVYDITNTYDDTDANGEVKAVIDFAGLTCDENVLISVKAIATGLEDATYTDGPEGVPLTYMVEHRLEVPDVSGLVVTNVASRQADEKSLESVQEAVVPAFLNNGLRFKLDNRAGEKLQLAVAIVEKPEEAGMHQVAKNGDCVNEQSGYWNTSATDNKVVTLIGKTATSGNETNKNGEFTYQFATDGQINWADYAGKYLKVTIRATAENAISSDWTDEDSEAGATVDYKYIRIPTVQLEDVTVKEEEVMQYYQNAEQTWTMEQGASAEYSAVFKTLTFDTQKYADCYKVAVIGDLSKQGIPAAWIYLQKQENGSGYDVFATAEASPEEDKDENKQIPACKVDETAVYVGDILPDAKNLVLPIGVPNLVEDMQIIKQNEEALADIPYMISLSQDGKLVSLVMPDMKKISVAGKALKDLKKAYDVTAYVNICASSLPNALQEVRYADSATLKWSQDGKTEKETKPSEKKAPEIAGPFQLATVADGDGVAYRLDVQSGDLIAKVMVRDDKQKLLGTYMLPLSTEKMDGVTKYYFVIADTYFGKEIDTKICFATCKDGVISDWTEEQSLTVE